MNLEFLHFPSFQFGSAIFLFSFFFFFFFFFTGVLAMPSLSTS
jgi:hypothetical protein